MNRQQALSEAGKCILVDRNRQYGSPENSFAEIAALWSQYLDVRIAPNQVAIMMTLLKIARIKNNPLKEDSWVDAIGYLACGAELIPNQEYCSATLSSQSTEKESLPEPNSSAPLQQNSVPTKEG